MLRFSLLAAAGILTACASTPDTDHLLPVPVFAEGEVPCEYEVIERVRVRNPTMATSEEDYLRLLREAYGKAGARVGADAVIARIPSPQGTARRREVGRTPAVSSGPPPGEAIRCIRSGTRRF